MSQIVVIAGWYIPKVGARCGSVRECSTDEEETLATKRAVEYVRSQGGGTFGALVLDYIDFEEFKINPAYFFEQVKEQATVAWLVEHPEESPFDEDGTPPPPEEIPF